jgi:hypothetical protein
MPGDPQSAGQVTADRYGHLFRRGDDSEELAPAKRALPSTV